MLASTALLTAPVLLAATLAPSSAFADGEGGGSPNGRGGYGGSAGSGGGGGNVMGQGSGGGAVNPTGPGAAGTSSGSNNGGGGGGAGQGFGGAGGSGNAGGGGGGVHGTVWFALPVAAASGTSGTNGTSGSAAGGGGGGGGFGAVVTGNVTGPIGLVGALTGGAGGAGGGNGNSGQLGSGGGGGGGGTALLIQGTVNGLLINQALTGGSGGTGGAAYSGGGGGGGGGHGVQFDSAVTSVTVSSTVAGGNGGAGGAANGNPGGGGGNGGAGMMFSGGGSVFVGSTVVGGNGGAGGIGAYGNGANGAGGSGIAGQNLSVFLNGGSVFGGLGGGFVTRGNALTFTGGANTLSVASGSLTGGAANLTGNVAIDSGSLTLNQSGLDYTLVNAITGGGALVKTGTSTVTLSGTSTYTGGTTLNAGALSISSDANLGGAGGGVTFNGGSLVTTANVTSSRAISVTALGMIDTGANRLTLNGPISGTNGLEKYGSGTLVLTGANTSAGTTIVGGAAEIANSAALGQVYSLMGTTLRAGANNLNVSSTGRIEAASTIDTQANTLTLSGAIQDYSPLGSLTKIGSGTLRLDATNTYTGATTVNAGTLSVNGSIASSSMTYVNTGGTLGGNGTVGNTTISGGVLSPGNSIGTLTVQGNLSFASYMQGTAYRVEVDPTGADRTNVTGRATIGTGAINGPVVQAIYAPGSYVTKQYTILNAAGGVTGTFASLVNTNLPANFTPSLSYDANNVYLNVTLNFTPPAIPLAPVFPPINFNQINVANGLIRSFNTVGGIPLLFGLLTPQQLTQIAGEIGTGTQQSGVNSMWQFLNAMFDLNAVGRGGDAGQGGVSSYADEALAYASTGKGRNASERDAYAAMARKAPPRVADAFNRWSVWATGYGGSQTTSGNAAVGSADTTARIYGATAGADYRFSPDTFVGFALGGAGTNYGLANGLGKGSSDVFQAGVYGRHQVGAAYIAAALAYGWQDVTTDRTVLGVDRLRARFDAHALSGRLESGYRFAALGMGVTPYAAGQFTTFFLPGYAEQVVAGSNLFALTYQSKDVTASRSELGLRTDKSFALSDSLLTLRGRAAWAHNFNTDRSVQAAFQTLPASGFIVNGAAQARDAALVSAGAEMAWRNGFALAASFEGEFSRNVESYAGKGSVRYRW